MNRNFKSLNEFAKFMAKRAIEADTVMALGLKSVAENTKTHIVNVMGDTSKLADNAQSTIDRKGFNAPLIDTGQMRDSLEVQASLVESGVGTEDEKMYWHEYGLGNYPERPAMYIGASEANEENKAIIISAAKRVVS